MRSLSSPENFLKAVLWLVSLHSALVGFGLIFLPNSAMAFFGFDSVGERFFHVQGGVFHLVMGIAYGIAATSAVRRATLTELAIIAKFLATFFLFSYYLLVAQVWMVLASAIGDLMLGLLVLLAYRRWTQERRIG